MKKNHIRNAANGKTLCGRTNRLDKVIHSATDLITIGFAKRNGNLCGACDRKRNA